MRSTKVKPDCTKKESPKTGKKTEAKKPTKEKTYQYFDEYAQVWKRL